MNWPEVLADLEKKREHIGIAIDVLTAYSGSLAPAAAPQALIEAPAEERPRRGRRAAKTAKVVKVRRKAAKQCDKHPDSTFYKNGQCRQCALDYQKKHAAKKKAEKPTGAYSRRAHMPGPKPKPHVPALDDLDNDELDIENDFRGEEGEPLPVAPTARQFMWSKPTRCPKCSEIARLRRLANADMAKDAWIHPGPNCIVKIAHYKIKDDPKFAGDPGATPPQERVRCPECNESFPNERSMEIHAERVHFKGQRSEPDDDEAETL